MSVQRTIKSYVVHNYGNLISAENPEFNEQTKTWEAEIKSDYPVFLQDDKNPEKNLLRFIPIKRIGIIRFNEKLTLLKNESTPREQIIETVRTLLDSWRSRTEKIVVQASANYLVRLPEFRHFFTPIDEIIGALLEKNIISDNALRSTYPRDKQLKLIKYLKLLEGLGYVRQINKGYETAEMFLLLRAHEKYAPKKGRKRIFKEEEFRQAIISDALKRRYVALRDAFEVSRLQPTIHVDSCIYSPSLEAEELIHLSKATIDRNYTNSYGHRLNPLTLDNILRRLKTFGVINRDGDYWSGTKKLLSNMLEIKKEMPELAPPFAAP